MLRLASVGAVSYAGGSAFFYLSSLHIGTGPAMVIFFSFPVFVVLFSRIFDNTRLNKYVMLALIMVVTGLVLLNGVGEHNLSNKGIILALVASFCYAVYVYFSRHSSSKVDTLWLTLFICIGCSSIFLVFAYANNTFQIPHGSRAWRDILILGVLATAIPIQLLLNGLKYISSVKASILSVLEPVMTVIIGVLFLHERLEWMQIIGILVILSGAMVIQFEKQPEFKAKTPLK
jgi:drug/metabolite transporter (DMT)-like permease